MTEAGDRALAEMAHQWRISNMIAWRWLDRTRRLAKTTDDLGIEKLLHLRGDE